MEAEWENFMITNNQLQPNKENIVFDSENDICKNCKRSLERWERVSGTCDECLGFQD